MKNVIPQTKEDNLEGIVLFLKENLHYLRDECDSDISIKVLNRVQEYIDLLEYEERNRNNV